MIEPKLRFKADDGSQFPDWEEKTFNDVADYKKGPFGSALKKEIFVPKSNDTVKVYEQQNAISKDWKLERYFVTNEYFQSKMKSFAVSGGDIIVSCAGTIGEMYELPDDAEEGIINQALMRVRIKKSVINSMIFRCVFDKMISTEGVKISNGSALKNIPPFADMKKQSVFVPSLPEQQKIAEFLSTVDTVIAKQKETVSAWEERKKGVMQKLFSQEVRFKADDGSDFPEWEEKSYLSICNVFADGDWIESKDQSDSGIRLIQTGNIGNGIFIDKDDKKKYISKETFDRLKCNEVFEGDILISRLPSPAGRACIVPKLNDRIITAVDCTIVRTDKSIISHDYCVQFMQSSKHFYYVASMMAGGTRQRISRKNLEDELISVPCLEEQQKIADCLSALDEVIEKQQATLAAWEELKKGLQQQMFV